MGCVLEIILVDTKLADFGSIPAETGPIHDPALVLVLEKLNGQRLWPASDDGEGGMVLDDVFVRLEVDSVVGDVVPCVVHLNVQPGTGEEFEPEKEWDG